MSVETEKGRILASVLTENQDLKERIRTLESACEAALKYLKRVGTGELVEIEAENRVIEQLEAIKHG